MSPRMLATGCFVALALFLQPVAAQTMYKSTMPDGRVVYGDRPEPNAVKVESSKPDTAKTGVQLNAPGAEREVQKMEAARASSEAKDKQMRGYRQHATVYQSWRNQNDQHDVNGDGCHAHSKDK